MSRLHHTTHLIAIALMTSSSLSSSLQAQPAPPGERIDRVVVFADRAEVSRAVTATCRAGAASATFSRLPDSVDPRTLRGEASGDAVVVGVSTTTIVEEENLDERVKALQQEIRAIDDRLDASRRAQEDDDERQRSIGSYGSWFRTVVGEELRQPKPDVARFEQLLAMMTAESQTAASTRVARQAEQRTLSRQRERLLNRLAGLSQGLAGTARHVGAVVSVRCGGDTTPTVRLAYVVPAARWYPEYDLRFTGPAGKKVGDGSAVLTVAGVITQSSGEDWSDAELWLSTAKPKLGGEAPLPNPLYVRGGPDDSQKTLVQAQEERAADLKAGRGNASTVKSASLDDGGKAFVLKLPRRVTVRADGRPYWFPVDDLTTKAKSSLVAVPALSPYVYQVAAWSNPAAFPLIEGTVHVYRGRTFVGDATLDYRAPGEPIELSLGLDEEIMLERQDILHLHKEAGFFADDKTIARSWRTILHNRSDGDVTVELREQIPVSKNADIKVQIEQKVTTAGFGLDAVRGHLTWKVTLKKGAKEERDLAFAIALPKDWAVN
jgi:uncharacterized protein (TIGR02231 family)